ncbi:MAG: hypothetical protein AB7D26_13095 [Marinobacterium sp.]|jgi:hypothetical protein
MNAAVEERRGRRKPIQMELIGGKPARQRVWEQIRIHRDRFEIYTIARRAEADDETVETYVRCLVAGGFVVKLTKGRELSVFQLIKDNGIEAPRLTRDGQPVTQGLGQEAMWRCLRMLGAMDSHQLALHAASSGVEVKPTAAKRYLQALKKAGYLEIVKPCNRTKGQKEILRLIPRMDSGPRPPQIQRVGVVYDPNWNKVMHADEPEELL